MSEKTTAVYAESRLVATERVRAHGLESRGYSSVRHVREQPVVVSLIQEFPAQAGRPAARQK